MYFSLRQSYLFPFLLFVCCACLPKHDEPPIDPSLYVEESTSEFDQRMEWWRDAHFGMFIHWGIYSVPAGVYQGKPIKGIGEWIMEKAEIPVEEYEGFSAQFNPTQFQPYEWAKLAATAGMKYMVITSKHHDGFCLWDSELTTYDIMDSSPFKRDIIGELKAACDSFGIKLGLYHSIMDWHHPDAQAPHYPHYDSRWKSNPRFSQYYTEYLTPQVRELVQKYEPAILWFDGEWIPEYTHAQGLGLYKMLRDMSPSILVNNRVDKGRRGKQGMNNGKKKYAGDFGTPEQEILQRQSTMDWEACMTMNDTWGFKSTDDNWKTAKSLIHNLVDIVSKGGNYLLNVGPDAMGSIPQASVERLQKIGAWMQVNQEAIYQSRPNTSAKPRRHLRFTQSKEGSAVYAIALKWPGKHIVLEGVFPKNGSEIFLLGHQEALTWQLKGQKLHIDLPPAMEDSANRPCDYAWVFKISPQPVAS